MKRSGYDYRKVFFKRPLWTEDVVVFSKILTITGILLLTITALYVSFFLKPADRGLSPKLKEKYISRLAEISRNDPVWYASNENEPGVWITMLPEDSLATQLTMPEPEKEPIRAVTPRPDRELPARIQPAVNVPPIPRPEPPEWAAAAKSMDAYRAQRRAYEKTIRQHNRDKDKVTLPESQFTDFEIISGIRDDEETLAIASENRKLLQHCIDRVHRLNANVRGNIVVKFAIHPEGYIIPESVRIIDADVPDPQVLQCVKRSIKRWRNFPRIAYELGVYTLTQKYIF